MSPCWVDHHAYYAKVLTIRPTWCTIVWRIPDAKAVVIAATHDAPTILRHRDAPDMAAIAVERRVNGLSRVSGQ
jgi:hypothetical protein